MVVRGDDAQRLGLRTISDVAKVKPPMRLGVGYEFAERPDGLRGLSAAYGLKFDGSPRTMELGLLYRALQARQVDIVAGNSTDGAIKAHGFVALEDDRHYFPPYEAVPLVREDSLKRWPQIGVAMERLAGKVSDEDMRAMNLAVESEHRDVAEVVREFRARKGVDVGDVRQDLGSLRALLLRSHRLSSRPPPGLHPDARGDEDCNPANPETCHARPS